MAESAEILPETIFIFNFNKTSTEMSFECKQQEDVCVCVVDTQKGKRSEKNSKRLCFVYFPQPKTIITVMRQQITSNKY